MDCENWADKLRKFATANKALYLVLIKKSEPNLNNKDMLTSLHGLIQKSHVFYTVWKEACIGVDWFKLFTRARWSQSHTNNGIFRLVESLLPVDSCFFSRSKRYTWLTAISNVSVSLHYLPKFLRSKVTSRTPIQWFQTNLDLNTKSTHIHTIKTQKACVTNKNTWLCFFVLKRYNRILI